MTKKYNKKMGNETSEETGENEMINPESNLNEPIFNFENEEKDKKNKENISFVRRKEQRKTIAASSNSPRLQSLKSMMKGSEEKKGGKSLFAKKSNDESNKKEDNNKKYEKEIIPSHFQRRGNRSISLVEKRKLGSQVFKDELKIKVSINSLVNETQGLPTKKYKVTNKIGEGSYGAVYLAHNIYTKQRVAIKRIVKNDENKIDELELKNEIDILKKLSHPNILKIIEFYSSEHSYYIITDHCAN